MFSPCIRKITSEQVQAWGTFHLVITDTLSFLEEAARVLKVDDVQNLEDYVPLKIPFGRNGQRLPIMMPTHLAQGITEERMAGVPWIGYIHLRAKEKQYLTQSSRSIHDFTSGLMRLRLYPKGFEFLTHTEVQHRDGKTTLVRNKTGPAGVWPV